MTIAETLSDGFVINRFFRYAFQPLCPPNFSTTPYWPGGIRQIDLAKGNHSKCLDPHQLVELQTALHLKEFLEALRQKAFELKELEQ